MKSKRIEFWVNIEYLAFMTGLLSGLKQAGFDPVQKFQVSQAAYRSACSTPARLWLRLRMYLVYPAQISLHFLFHRSAGLSVVSTGTFFAPLLAVLFASRRRTIIHLVYDLFPDVLVHANSIHRGGIFDRVISALTRMTFHRCSANVFLGHRLLEYAERQYGSIPNAVVIPVGADGTPFTKRRWPENEAPVMLYCGNVGRMHDISTLPEALRKAATDLSSLRILFHANGPAYARLQTLVKAATAGKTAGMPEVCFSKALPGPEWETVMQQAAIALVTMAPGGAETVMPSKTYSAMVAGQAILAICPRQSDLADLIQKHDCGWVVEPGDADGLARVLADITRDPHLVLQKQKRAHEAGHRFYDTTGTIALLWRDLIAGLEEKNT